MNRESTLLGDWMASVYLPDGARIEHYLTLKADGRYRWQSEKREAEEGTWRFEEAQSLLYFLPASEASTGSGDRPQVWRVLKIEGCEDATDILVIRWVAAISPNLPLVFYRVTVPAS